MQTIQQNRRISFQTGHAQKRIRSNRSQAQKRTCGNVANDFLRHPFAPLLLQNLEVDYREAEMHFFASVRNLETAYGLEPTPVSLRPYPYNILDAFNRLKEIVDAKSEYEKLFLIENGKNPYCLATGMAWDTGYHLYYIPFEPLLNMIRKKYLKKEANLLISVCSYLAQVVGVPSYGKGDGVHFVYEQLDEWMEQEVYEYDDSDDNDEEWSKGQKEYRVNAFRELEVAKYWGKKLQKTIQHPYHLEALAQRTQSYRATSEKELELKAIAEKMLTLYKEYPNRNFYSQYYPEHWFSPSDNIMRADEYLSFIWSYEGWLGEQAYQYVCDSSEGYDGMEEPIQFKIYDEPMGRMANNLEFEKRLFILIDELSYFINNF